MQPEFLAILKALADEVRRPKYKKGKDPIQQSYDMINRSGYAEGAWEVLSALYDKDPKKKEFKF